MSDEAKQQPELPTTTASPLRKIRTRRGRKPADAESSIQEFASHLSQILNDKLTNKPARIFFTAVQFAYKIARILDPEFDPKKSKE